MPGAAWLPPIAEKRRRGRRAQLVLVGLHVAAALAVAAGGYLAYRHIARDGDDNGQAFRSALVRAASRDGLREPIAVARLARFEWDTVAVLYPYAEDGARQDIGEDAKKLPYLDEHEVAVYFIRDGRLAGWLLMSHEIDEAVGVDTRTCLRLDAPAPRRGAYLAARRGKLVFTTAGGPRARDAYGYCP